MSGVRPDRTYKLGQGERRLLHDLRHKGSRAVALEHKAKELGKEAKAKASAKEAALWYASDSVLRTEEGLDRSRSDKAADWPHTVDKERYCSICACFGCRAETPKE